MPRPYHHSPAHDEYIPHLHEVITGRVWDKMTTEQQVIYIKAQFVLAVRKLNKEKDKAVVTKSLEQLAKYLRKPVYNSTSFSFEEKGHFNTLCFKFLCDEKKTPQTKWGAIRALERRIRKCDKILNKKKLAAKNEFLLTMGIRQIDMEPTAEQLFHDIFAPEEEELAATKSGSFKLA